MSSARRTIAKGALPSVNRHGPGLLSTMARSAVLSGTTLAIERARGDRRGAGPHGGRQADDATARFRLLSELRDAGILPQEAYEAAVARLTRGAPGW